jgi:hypothetical protein
VDNDIRNDWLSAVHSTAASIATSYDAAIRELTSAPEVGFEIPGDFGPSRQPMSDEPVRTIPVAQAGPNISIPVDPVPTVPAAAQALPSSAMPEPQSLSTGAPDDAPPELAAPLSDAGGLSTGAGGLGGLGGITGGIGGVIGNIVDGIGSLIGSLTGGLGDTSGDPLLDDPNDDADDPDDDAEDAADTNDAEPIVDDAAPIEPAAPKEPAVDELNENAPATVEAADTPTAPPPVDPPPADQPPPAPVIPPEGSTPCEIAEDQLPQAGQ